MATFHGGRRRSDFRFAPINALVDNWKTLGLSYRDGVVAMTLWRKAGRTNEVAGITQEQLAFDLGIGAREIRRSLLNLERAGVLQRNRGTKHKGTKYTICPPVEPGG
ncbi:MAG: hypothetical protein WC718_17385, partial [Phycisphaerales bacterium]